METEECTRNIDPILKTLADKEINLEEQNCLPLKPTVQISMDTLSQSSPGLCYCCLELTCQKSLWQSYEWMDGLEIYGEMLEQCFGLSLSHHQNAKICEVCITQLRNALQFKAQVARCQSQLWDRDVKTDDQSISSMNTGQDLMKVEHIDDMDRPDDQDDDYEDSTVEITGKAKNIKSSTKRKKGRKMYIQIKKSSKVDRRTIAFQSSKFTRPRRSVALLLEHSTICPFKYSQAYFKCFYCTKSFLVFQELRSHVKECHSNLVFMDIAKCVTRPNDKVKADVSVISCRSCHMNFKNLEELSTHLGDKHNISFDGNPADSILGYDLADNKFKCTVCEEEFLFFKTLGKHMNDHATSHVCDVCGKCFLLIERLRSHVQLHSEVTMKCKHCNKNFPTRPSLKSHIRYMHEKKPFPCSICGESFPTYRKRLQHFVERHGRAPLSLQCEMCDRTFNSNSDLKRHVKYQHLMVPKEAKYTCEDCGRKFKTKRVLTGHMLVHSGEKNYECDVCKKKFGRQNSLKEHMKIHKNDKRWACGACAVCFVQKCSLKNHIRVHHAEYNVEDLIVYKNPDKL